MKTICSVSGGKSSAYMALHFPADHYVFAVVLTDHAPSAPADPGLLRECHRRIPHFIASHEADQTLVNMLRLEQELGQEITWVASEHSIDAFIRGITNWPGYRNGHAMLPNERLRFCTVEQKIKPIFWHCYLRHGPDPCIMQIGMRWDEPRRVEGWNCANDVMDAPLSCSVKGRQQFTKVEWRIPSFPLYDNRITREDVRRFWDDKGWEFSDISNCRFCFHHSAFKMQLQAQREPANLQWWLDMEAATGQTFGRRPLRDVLAQPLLPFDDEIEAPCACTD